MGYFLIGLAVFFLFFLFFPINICLSFNRINGDDEAKIVVRLFAGLIKINMKVPQIIIRLGQDNGLPTLDYSEEIYLGSNKDKGFELRESLGIPTGLWEKIQRDWKRFQAFYKYHKHWIKAFYDAVQIKKFCWETELGFANPALTGISIGLAWQLKGIITAFLSKKMCFIGDNYKINIKPSFREEKLITRLTCIFTFQIGYIIFRWMHYVVRK